MKTKYALMIRASSEVAVNIMVGKTWQLVQMSTNPNCPTSNQKVELIKQCELVPAILIMVLKQYNPENRNMYVPAESNSI